MKRPQRRPRNARHDALRVVDAMVRDEYIDQATSILLKDTHQSLRHALRGLNWWLVPSVELDNAQATSVLALLEAVFSTETHERRKRLLRAQWIALEWWYRTKWLSGELRKNVLADMCEKWKLRDTAIKKAIRDGRTRADRVRVIWRQAREGDRIPQVEALIAKTKKESAGSLRRGR